MKILKNRTFTWWQIGIFKVAMLFLGMAVGAYWHEILLPYLSWLVVVGVALSLYILYISFK